MHGMYRFTGDSRSQTHQIGQPTSGLMPEAAGGYAKPGATGSSGKYKRIY